MNIDSRSLMPADLAGVDTPRGGTVDARPRAKTRRRWRASPELVLLVIGAAAFTLVILIPVVAIFLRVLPQEQVGRSRSARSWWRHCASAS